jgi:Fe-S cluster biogenesis protein NfuA
VVIAFRGMCAGCQSAELTRRGFIEAKLREYVAEDIVVEEES